MIIISINGKVFKLSEKSYKDFTNKYLISHYQIPPPTKVKSNPKKYICLV